MRKEREPSPQEIAEVVLHALTDPATRQVRREISELMERCRRDYGEGAWSMVFEKMLEVKAEGKLYLTHTVYTEAERRLEKELRPLRERQQLIEARRSVETSPTAEHMRTLAKDLGALRALAEEDSESARFVIGVLLEQLGDEEGFVAGLFRLGSELALARKDPETAITLGAALEGLREAVRADRQPSFPEASR